MSQQSLLAMNGEAVCVQSEMIYFGVTLKQTELHQTLRPIGAKERKGGQLSGTFGAERQ